MPPVSTSARTFRSGRIIASVFSLLTLLATAIEVSAQGYPTKTYGNGSESNKSEEEGLKFVIEN